MQLMILNRRHQSIFKYIIFFFGLLACGRGKRGGREGVEEAKKEANKGTKEIMGGRGGGEGSRWRQREGEPTIIS